MARYDDDLILVALTKQILFETNGTAAWVLVRRSNGETHAKTVLGSVLPTVDQVVFARDLIDRLNKQVAHDGVWVVAWCDFGPDGMPARLMMLWKDADADLCFMLDTEDPIRLLAAAGVDSYVNDATLAYAHYRQLMKAAGVRQDQTRKAAQGQGSVDPTTRAPEA
jgi:hypothetical protein